MKTTLNIEIETSDDLEVYPESGQSEEDFKGETNQKELKKFQEEFRKELHEKIVNLFKDHTDDGLLEEYIIENLEDVSIEDYLSFDDYGIKINFSVN